MTVAGRLARPVDWALRQEPRHGHPAHPRGEARPPAGPRPQPRPPLHRLRRDASHDRLEHLRLTPGPHGGPGAHPGPGAGPALRPLLAGALRARRRVRGAALRPPPVRGRTEPRPFTNTITSCRRLSSARSPCRSRPRTRSPTTSLSRLAALPAGERADIVRLLVVAMIIDWRIPRSAQPGAGTTPDRGPPGSLHRGSQAPGDATFVAGPGLAGLEHQRQDLSDLSADPPP